MLVNPISPNTAPEIGDMQAAAQTVGLQVKTFNASTPAELNAAFVAIAEQRPDALQVGSDPFFANRRQEIVALAARLGIRRSTRSESMSPMAACSATGRTSHMFIGRLATTPDGFSRALSPPTFRSCGRPPLSW